MDRKKVVLAFGSGGHAAQGMILVNHLINTLTFSCVVESDDFLVQQKLRDLNITYDFAPKARGTHERSIFTLYRIICCFIKSFYLALKLRPDNVISTGPGMGLVFCLCAKMLGAKITFIESWSRVCTKSISAKYAYHFSDQFFYQWPEQKQNYPKGIWAGRLFETRTS